LPVLYIKCLETSSIREKEEFTFLRFSSHHLRSQHFQFGEVLAVLRYLQENAHDEWAPEKATN